MSGQNSFSGGSGPAASRSEAELRRHRERQARALRFRQPRRTAREVPADVPDEETPGTGTAGIPPVSGFAADPVAEKEMAEKAAVKAARRAKRRRLSAVLTKLLLLAVELLLLTAAVRGLLALYRQTQPVSFTLRYLVPGQEDLVDRVSAGETAPLRPGVDLEGYTFLYWERPDGTPETESEVLPEQDTVYTARYALAFPTDKHPAYLTVDEDGVFGVNEPVTMRELVLALHRLLNLDRVGKGEFQDVDPDDACHTAAATLKDLGILRGDWLYPDDRITRADLLELLSRFYPETDASFSFPDLEPGDDAWPAFCLARERGWIEEGEAAPAETVTRGELARILNRVLGRSPLYLQPEEAVGTILDVPPTHPYYADVAEAVIVHDYTDGEGFERWTDSSPLPSHEPGLFFLGVRLHYIGEDGKAAVNTTVDGRSYNECGELTSGNGELDRRLWEILENTVDPSSMSEEEMLRAVYQYVVRNFTRHSQAFYPPGAEDWAADAALQLLKDGDGSSHGFAALFYELAVFTGWQPRLISGAVYGQQTLFIAEDGTEVRLPHAYTPHAWVEIRADGLFYLYDPEMEVRYDGTRSFFRFYDPVRWQKGYRSNF